MRYNLAMDSGAYSIFGKFAFGGKGRVGKPNYDFYKSERFSDYFNKYCVWCKENREVVAFYVTLDALQNPELSWELYQQMRKQGLDPLPVVHAGEDVKWIKKYMGETDYIGVGVVMGTNFGSRYSRMEEYRVWASSVFKLLGKTHRAHGFAATDFSLIRDFPFYSVDSARSSWVSSFGQVLFPKPIITKGKVTFIYMTRPYIFVFTHRSDRRQAQKLHINNGGDVHHRIFREYLSQFGFEIDQVSKEGREGYHARAVVNADFFCQLQEEVKRVQGREFKLYLSGSLSGGSKPGNLLDEFDGFKRVPEFNYLGSFFALGTFNRFREALGRYDKKPERAQLKKRVGR